LLQGDKQHDSLEQEIKVDPLIHNLGRRRMMHRPSRPKRNPNGDATKAPACDLVTEIAFLARALNPHTACVGISAR
jgi:hypothetical protein